MIEREINKPGVSLLYLLLEQPGAVEKPELKDFMAVQRICSEFKAALGEYPRDKMEVALVDDAGAPVLDEVGKPRMGKQWRLDYPKHEVVTVRFEPTDHDLLVGIWDKHDKSKFMANEEVRLWAITIDHELKGKAIPSSEPVFAESREAKRATGKHKKNGQAEAR